MSFLVKGLLFCTVVGSLAYDISCDSACTESWNHLWEVCPCARSFHTKTRKQIVLNDSSSPYHLGYYSIVPAPQHTSRLHQEAC
eukprot:scaffold83971_cov84-Attheya_sp.AAC.1